MSPDEPIIDALERRVHILGLLFRSWLIGRRRLHLFLILDIAGSDSEIVSIVIKSASVAVEAQIIEEISITRYKG